jgi:hypothetical protein
MVTVTVTTIINRDRDRESRACFRVHRDWGFSFINCVYCWRRWDIPSLLFKTMRIYSSGKKKNKNF